MKIQNTKDISNNGLFALIVGSSGVGKTTLAKTLKEKTLVLSAESGLLSLSGFDIDYINIETSKDLSDAFKYLQAGTDYKNIVIDSLTEVSEMIFHELKPKFQKKENFNLYDEYSTKITTILKWFRDLKGYNIFMTCLDKIIKVGIVETISLDMVQKSLSKKIPPLFDEVFYYKSIQQEDGTFKRALITNNDIIDFAKDRSGKLNELEKPDLQNIIEKIFN